MVLRAASLAILSLRLWIVASQVTVTFRPHWVHVLPGRATEQALVVDVLAPQVTGTPPPQELALLFDVSLSMAEGGKLDLAKAAAERIIRSLRVEDRIHLISCHSFARLEFQHGHLGQKEQLLQKLRQLSAKTETAARQMDGSLVDQDISNISDGLRLAEHILVGPLATPRVNTSRRAILFSDGLFTGPSSRDDALFDAIAGAKVAGFSTSVVGLGTGRAMDRWLLEQAAKVYCPVIGCQCSDPSRSPGWASDATMRSHIDSHLAGTLAGEVDGLPLPALEEIQSARTPTLRHVPTAARHTWAQVLTRALAAVAHHNDERAAAAFTLDRLQRWQEGEHMALWHTRPVHQRRTGTPPTPEERRDMAVAFGREGFDRKACAALMSPGLCPPNAETVRSLEALHPQGPPPSERLLQDLPLPPDIAPELVARSLRAFPAETAPGPTGLRVQHLREACLAGAADNLLAQLAAVVQLLAQGRAPAFVAPVLAGAGLVALPKPSGGVRPIAVGELLRRLTGKCLMALVQDDARTHFWPAQVGVAVKGGAEKAIHTVRAWAKRHAGSSSKVLVKLDFSNAFNSVSQEAVLHQTTANFPAMARWAVWCYRQPTRSLGPLAVLCCSQPVASELRACPLDIAVHFLDDGILAGDIPAVGAALLQVQRRAAEIGLALNLAKCEVVVCGPVPAAALSANFPSAMLRKHDGASKVLDNFEFLGAAIGSDSFVNDHTGQRAAKAAELLNALADLDDPQAGLGYARAGLGLRRTVGHAPAAYLASLGKSLSACVELDPSFSGNDLLNDPDVVQALNALNAQLPGHRALTLEAVTGSSQRDLSQHIDSAEWDATVSC
ncbi:unnamed protein product [Symbiodinium natans]|uniref:VWFA domain-containing protein n=1 Tax=Symbiodinium natans TaxID=878477 RepID=A0A812QDJ5_9DINO|nr:unnamed protein product [Symbiodinium natans]